jgi:hypothetical protein
MALAGYADEVWLAFAMAGGLLQARFTPGTGWTDITPAAPSRSAGPFGVSLEVFGGYLFLVYADLSGKLFWSSEGHRIRTGDLLEDPMQRGVVFQSNRERGAGEGVRRSVLRMATPARIATSFIPKPASRAPAPAHRRTRTRQNGS